MVDHALTGDTLKVHLISQRGVIWYVVEQKTLRLSFSAGLLACPVDGGGATSELPTYNNSKFTAYTVWRNNKKYEP